MSNEKDVPQTNVDIAAYRRAVQKNNKKVLRKQRTQDTVKGVLIVVVLGVIALVIYTLTQVLLTSRPPAAHVPGPVLIGMAIIGAVLITGGLTLVIVSIISIVQVLWKDVGFHPLFVSAGAFSIVVTTVAAALVIVLYLFVFYNA
jgi:hypothetical protein